MTLIIVTILILSYLLIATSNLTKVNKTAIAIFAAAVGWVLYICYGTDFVMSQHSAEYIDFLGGAIPTSTAVKHYIAQNIFLKYVGRGAEIVLFLLATMTIVEILNNNGCFDFLTELMKTRNSRKLLWMMTGITFVVSANLDNITTTTMMLVVMHGLIPNRRHRIIYGCAIVLAANCGGALTVIGDPTGLLLWNNGAVTASRFSASLAIPCLVSCALPVFMLGRMLPERISIEWVLPYRGDDTNLSRWQRIMMLFVGIGGLWFIPTFHNITKLSPFIGALCVLSLLWIVNEIVNRKLMNVDKMIQRRMPRVLQYGVIQMMLFVMGMMLAVGVVYETGALSWQARNIDYQIHNIWIVSAMAAVMSSMVDSFATSLSFISLYPIVDAEALNRWTDADYMASFVQNGNYWKVIAYSTAMGGNFMLTGSLSGLALMKMERIHVGWYLRNVGLMSFMAWIIGMFVIMIMTL
ncbi:SLC13 family permease [Prevotella sp. OH937_COT-195]|uniref:SLC13 family permease n=1 Tax=Prevotella sp. OH937_COT-195 TaxID=2491051 RepID=UPI000F652922|nr:SLC13 family permease [Prevotella sp. OH937_COT-195]RRD00892.1 sodium:proton antiporter [Prevotella sp. OH937_COT-195]